MKGLIPFDATLVLTRLIEHRFSRRIPEPAPLPDRNLHPGNRPLRDGDTVAILGGGLSGSAFARQLLMLSSRENLNIRVIMINSPNCNYCGGLVTRLAHDFLERFYELDFPEELVLDAVREVIYLNRGGSIPVDLGMGLYSILRTSRFGETGFDDSLKYRITEGLDRAARNRFTLIEPARVLEVIPPGNGLEDGIVRYLAGRRGKGSARAVKARLIALAMGFRGLGAAATRAFSESTGYRPPQMMSASVTEIDAGGALYNTLQGKLLIINDVIDGAVAAIIPKRKDWLTVTSLHKPLTVKDVARLFEHPLVKEHVDLPGVVDRLRCNRVCRCAVFTGGAANFYGDGWLVLGDMNGHGRVLKDGYLAALYSAYLAARCAIYDGTSRRCFARGFHRPLRSLELDNWVGMRLFYLNFWLSRRDWFPRYLRSAGIGESLGRPYGGFIHSAIRGITTGEISYKMIAALLVAGLGCHLLRCPILAKGGKRP